MGGLIVQGPLNTWCLECVWLTCDSRGRSRIFWFKIVLFTLLTVWKPKTENQCLCFEAFHGYIVQTTWANLTIEITESNLVPFKSCSHLIYDQSFSVTSPAKAITCWQMSAGEPRPFSIQITKFIYSGPSTILEEFGELCQYGGLYLYTTPHYLSQWNQFAQLCPQEAITNTLNFHLNHAFVYLLLIRFEGYSTVKLHFNRVYHDRGHRKLFSDTWLIKHKFNFFFLSGLFWRERILTQI